MPQKRLTPIARTLRANGTEAEQRLWYYLRNRQVEGAKFRRQRPIGSSVTDFVCEQARLVIELDGGQHTPEKDAPRTRSIEANRYTIIRFWNHDVLANIEGVVEEIRAMLKIARLIVFLSFGRGYGALGAKRVRRSW
jgi:very-short-patch-repair endonuclease